MAKQEGIPLDAMELLQRVANIDPNLYHRVVAEAQRDKLMEQMNQPPEKAPVAPNAEEPADG